MAWTQRRVVNLPNELSDPRASYGCFVLAGAWVRGMGYEPARAECGHVLQSGKLLRPFFCSEDVYGKRECVVCGYSCEGTGNRRMLRGVLCVALKRQSEEVKCA
jgi:hypothetical protein